MIDKTARIHKTCKIDKNVHIGPFSIIGKNTIIGKNCTILSNVVIGKNTVLGKNNKIFQFSSIGEDPIDHSFHGEFSQLIIGNNNIIRECSTIHSGTAKEKGTTKIGNNNLIMNYVHIGHDCEIKDNTMIVNGAALAGHVKVDNFATIGAHCGIHQFCHIGMYSFIAHRSSISKDVPPFLTVISSPITSPCGINSEGLKRSNYSYKKINDIKKSYKIIYRKGLLIKEAIKKLSILEKNTPEIYQFIKFLKKSKRGIIR